MNGYAEQEDRIHLVDVGGEQGSLATIIRTMRAAVVSLALAALAGILAPAHAKAGACQSSTFSPLLGLQTIPGAEVVEVRAQELHQFDSPASSSIFRSAKIDACEVKLDYINPATNSTTVTVTVWLPKPDRWNGRFLGRGGGGWQCSLGLQSLNAAVEYGAAAATTNGGLRGLPFETDYTLLSPGNPDKFLLERLGHRAIHDMTVGAKQIIELFYGKRSSSNYYMGCSTGGRQGMMEASRYPEDYDGLLIGAPAYRFGKLAVRLLAETAVMNMYNTYPSKCELDAIREAAIEACDHLDGRKDGIISRQDLCKFTAQRAIGREYVDTCDGNGEQRMVSPEAARVYQIATTGAFDSKGRSVGPGYPWGTHMGLLPVGSMITKVDPKTGDKSGVPFPFSRQYVEDYILNGLQPVDWKKVTLDDLTHWQKISIPRYNEMLEPPDDMSAFRDRGGKIILYHGEEDVIIPVGVSFEKLDGIRTAMYPDRPYGLGFEAMQDFLRFFVVPGMSHCGVLPERAGKAPSVDGRAIQQLIQWVEAGQAPDRLLGDGVEDEAMSTVCRWPTLPHWTDDGKTLTCIKDGMSFLGRLPRLADLPVKYMEILPKMLFLRTEKLPGEL